MDFEKQTLYFENFGGFYRFRFLDSPPKQWECGSMRESARECDVMWRCAWECGAMHETGLLVKCGIAECGMRKVKYGIQKCGKVCGMVGKTRNAERTVCKVNHRS